MKDASSRSCGMIFHLKRHPQDPTKGSKVLEAFQYLFQAAGGWHWAGEWLRQRAEEEQECDDWLANRLKIQDWMVETSKGMDPLIQKAWAKSVAKKNNPYTQALCKD